MNLSVLLASPTFWGMVAGIAAVIQEWQYRVSGAWVPNLWYIFPMQLLISYAIFRLVTMPNTSLIDAFVVFAFSTTLLRVVFSIFVLEEAIKGGTWFALGLLIMARIAQTFWGR